MSAGLNSRILLLAALCLALSAVRPAAAVPVKVVAVVPSVIANDATTSLKITGEGFLPETQLSLVGGGIYEIGKAAPMNDFLPLGLAISDDLVFVSGLELTIVDAREPATSQVIGRSGFTGCLGRTVAVTQGHAYLADHPQFGRTLCVVEVSDPTRPMPGQKLELPCQVSRMAVSQEVLYLSCSSTGELLVMDLSEPARPVIAGSLPLGQGASGLAISGSLLFVVDAKEGLFTLSIDEPLAPVLLGHEPNAVGAGVTVDGSHAYVGGFRDRGLQVVDVSNPRHPRLTGFSPTGGIFEDPAAGNGFVFAGDNKRLWVHDVRNPRDPVLAYTLGGVATVFDFELSGDLLAVADQGTFTLRLFDVSHPEPPGLINQLDSLVAGVGGLIVGDRAYLRSRRIVDLSQPGRPRLMGCLPEGVPRAVQGYLAYTSNGAEFAIWDTKNPQRAVRLGEFTAPGRISDFAVAGSTAYIGLYEDGRVLLVDVSKPSMPRVMSVVPSVTRGGNPQSLSVTGHNLVYLDLGSTQRLGQIVDVENPAAPRLLGQFAFNSRQLAGPGQMVARGSFIYAADGSRGLQILDMSEPNTPVLVASLPKIGASLLRLAGDTVFVFGEIGHFVVDISDPFHPRVAGGIGWRGSVVGVKDGFVYLASGLSGLQVVQDNPLLPPVMVESAERATLEVPAGLAPGNYHVMALAPDGEPAFLHNAIEITGDPVKEPPLRPGRDHRPSCPSL